jgi:hypothetical protein
MFLPCVFFLAQGSDTSTLFENQINKVHIQG